MPKWTRKKILSFGKAAEIWFEKQIKSDKLVFIDDIWDFEYNGIPIEVKSAQLCVNQIKFGTLRFNTGFTLKRQQHKVIQENNGWYCFALMIERKCIYAIMAPIAEVKKRYVYKDPRGDIRVRFSIFYNKKCLTIKEFQEKYK